MRDHCPHCAGAWGKDSVTQASAAAAGAQIVLNSEHLKVETITAHVDREVCTGCGLCAKVCPYDAILADSKTKMIAQVMEAKCSGCGTCSAECRFDAITMCHFPDVALIAHVESAQALTLYGKISGASRADLLETKKRTFKVAVNTPYSVPQELS